MFQTLLGTFLLVFSIYALDHMGIISDEQADAAISHEAEEHLTKQVATSTERFTDRIVRLHEKA